MKSIEQQLAEAKAQLETLVAENKTLQAKVTESAKASAQAELGKLMTEAKLPEPAQKRLQAHFAEAVSADGMKEMVASEAEYIKSLAPAPKKNNGAGDNAQLQESDSTKIQADKAKLVETLKSQGMSEADAKGIAGL